MPETKHIRTSPLTTRSNKTRSLPPSLKQAEELMELAVDAAQSRLLPEFLERFAGRAARMLNAAWGGGRKRRRNRRGFRAHQRERWRAAGDAVPPAAAKKSGCQGKEAAACLG